MNEYLVASVGDSRWTNFKECLLGAATDALVIWDFDGVVADSEPLHAESYRALLAEAGHHVPEDFFVKYIGNTESEIWQQLAQDGFAVDASTESLSSRRQHVFRSLARGSLRPSWLAAEMVPLFNELGVAQTIVSNGDPGTIAALLDEWDLRLDLDHRPTSADGRMLDKSDRLRQLVCGHRSVTIEDNPGYLAIASAAGSFTVAVVHPLAPLDAVVSDLRCGL
jgi:beta-phosphoglucomutase-like phosphatase (HAD superfamily)